MISVMDGSYTWISCIHISAANQREQQEVVVESPARDRHIFRKVLNVLKYLPHDIVRPYLTIL